MATSSGLETPEGNLESSRSSQHSTSSSNSLLKDISTFIWELTTSKSPANSSPPQKSKTKWYRHWNPLRWGPVPAIPTTRSTSPEYTANWFSQMTFQWMTSIMEVGYRRPLELNDIWSVNPTRQIDLLASRFDAAFERHLENKQTNPLLWALHDAFRFEFWLGGVCVLVSSICQVMSPFTLRFLIQFVTDAYYAKKNNTEQPPIGRGLGIVFAIMFMQCIQSLGTNQFIYRGFMVGAQARGVLISAIFEKAMRISGRARPAGKEMKEKKEAFFKGFSRKNNRREPDEKMSPQKDNSEAWTNGRVMNMMSTDTSRIEQACGMFHLLWVSPLTITITLIMLLVNITYSALAGFSLLFLGIPLLAITMKKLIVRRNAISKVTDSRVSLTQETIRSVRFVKYYGWEDAFRDRLHNLRRIEVGLIQRLLAMRNAMNAVSVSLPIFAAMVSFIVYSVSNHTLTPAVVFSSLSLFNALRVPFNLLPVVIGQLTDAWTALKRVQDYLLADDHKEDVHWDMAAPRAIRLQDASFDWAADSDSIREKPILQDINLSIGSSELVAVIGSVGSGKTSLLSALAGEMHRTSGTVTLGALRAFCPQYAWIQNTTVKNNILFGREFNEEWYKKVLHACALEPDMAILPAGDETEIGERGITLSGGQRQRLNIARAIYFNSDIVLLDDPLSAVDAHVGRHIFDHAICGVLDGKCRILATHKLDILQRCDRVIWLDQGQIKAFDTFDRLMSTDVDFQEMVASTSQGKESADISQHTQQNTETAVEKHETTSLMQDEDRCSNSVGWDIYTAYIRATGSIWNGLLPILLLVVAQGSNILTSLWLSYWTENKFSLSKGSYIGIYISLGIIQATLMFSYSLSVSILATIASRTMLHRATERILKAPMSFFDTTPLGRITNRFSKDVDTTDNNLADAIRMYLYTVAMITSVFVLLIVYFHYFGIALAVLLTLFLFAAAYYRSSAREMKRHEAVLRSVVFARFSEALTGTSSIRVYGVQSHFTSVLRKAIDDMNSAYYLTFSNQRWLSTRLDVISNLLVATTGILVVTLRDAVSPSISGLVFSYILSIVQMIQLLVRQLAEVENAMNSTERVQYYGSSLEQERSLCKVKALCPCWPQKGAITFDNVHMRYRDGLPLVLKGLDLDVKAGERIGIVGRTGAGKSSIMTALFRLTELSEGQILIDGTDISRLSLSDLRSRLTIIPQDPTLFHGTIRSNLDPFDEHTDLELWSALRQAGLVDNTSTSIHLDTSVDEEGLNFSLGQRQLMALARALVRGSQIIVCDEATSSVDLQTDQKIQETIRTRFHGRTLLCIAHRLKTIIQYDRICVMDQGCIAELGTPVELWEKQGIFWEMCEKSGIVRGDL